MGAVNKYTKGKKKTFCRLVWICLRKTFFHAAHRHKWICRHHSTHHPVKNCTQLKSSLRSVTQTTQVDMNSKWPLYCWAPAWHSKNKKGMLQYDDKRGKTEVGSWLFGTIAGLECNCMQVTGTMFLGCCASAVTPSCSPSPNMINQIKPPSLTEQKLALAAVSQVGCNAEKRPRWAFSPFFLYLCLSSGS